MTPEPDVTIRRILLVDDNELSTRHAAATLENVAGDIRTVRSGRAAIALAADWHPDIIFVDLHLEDIEGLEVVHKIRQDWPATRPQPKMVILTGDSSALDAADPEKLEIDCVLRKPVSGHQLRDCIRMAPIGIEENTPDDRVRAELQALFQKELQRRLPELDHCMARLERERVAQILHQLIASAAITGHQRLESQLRELDVKNRESATAEEIACCYHAVLQSAGYWMSCSLEDS
jgi:CheY-like chemotaxis protein